MLVSFVKSHIRPYMDEIVTLMRVSRKKLMLWSVPHCLGRGISGVGLDKHRHFLVGHMELSQPKDKVEEGAPLGCERESGAVAGAVGCGLPGTREQV